MAKVSSKSERLILLFRIFTILKGIFDMSLWVGFQTIYLKWLIKVGDISKCIKIEPYLFGKTKAEAKTVNVMGENISTSTTIKTLGLNLS